MTWDRDAAIMFVYTGSLLTIRGPLGLNRQILSRCPISNERLHKPTNPPVQATSERAKDVPLLFKGSSLLLELPLRLSDLPGLHAGEPVGYVLQQYQLAMSGLR